jgi:hypothetical protein
MVELSEINLSGICSTREESIVDELNALPYQVCCCLFTLNSSFQRLEYNFLI